MAGIIIINVYQSTHSPLDFLCSAAWHNLQHSRYNYYKPILSYVLTTRASIGTILLLSMFIYSSLFYLFFFLLFIYCYYYFIIIIYQHVQNLAQNFLSSCKLSHMPRPAQNSIYVDFRRTNYQNMPRPAQNFQFFMHILRTC